MMFIEGHPAVDGLAHPAALPEAASDVLRAVREAGFPVGRDAGVGRADGTVTMGFEDRRRGVAVLQGVAALDFPRSKPIVYGKPPQTVYVASERGARRLARIYDKGLESSVAPAGRLVRFENQVRYSKQLRRVVEDVDLGHVSGRFRARFEPLAKSASGVSVASMPVLAAAVADRVASGEIAFRQAERLLGFMTLHQAGCRRGVSRSSLQRRRRELRAAGLVLADDFFEPVEVNLGDTIEAALAAWNT
jgi:hypothetical protein